MEEKIKHCKTQAAFTIYFNSDFEPSIISKIIGVNAKKIVLKKDAEISQSNPYGLGFFQIATNVAEEKFAEHAITTILRPFINKDKEINKLVEDNNGYCQLDLYVKVNKNATLLDISLSKNAMKLLTSLNAKFKVNLM